MILVDKGELWRIEMTENTMKNQTTKLDTPHKKTVGNILKTIVLFPFRLIWTIIKFGFLALIAIFLALTIYCVSQFNKPMTIPEAKGLTYSQFLNNRYDAFMKYDSQYCAHWNKTDWLCEHATGVPRMAGLPFYQLSSVPQSVWAVFFPGGKVDNWLKAGDATYSYDLPKGKVQWTNITDLYWEAIQRSTYSLLVIRVNKVPFDATLPNK